MNARIKRLTITILTGCLMFGSGCPLLQFFQPPKEDGIVCDLDDLDLSCELNLDFDD